MNSIDEYINIDSCANRKKKENGKVKIIECYQFNEHILLQMHLKENLILQ